MCSNRLHLKCSSCRGLNVHVTCADIAEDRLEASRAVGADAGLVWPIDASEEQLIDITGAAGKMDAIFDIVGTPKTFRASFYSLNNGGTLVPIGFGGGHGAVPLPHIIGRSITIAGNRVGNPHQLRALCLLIQKEGIPSLPPTEIYQLSQANEVLDKMRGGKSKVVRCSSSNWGKRLHVTFYPRGTAKDEWET